MGRERHRGAPDDPVEFSRRYVLGRLEGFEKDIDICLTGAPRKDVPSEATHAYFPALMTCYATLEYLTGFYKGSTTRKYRSEDISEFANKYLTDEYTEDLIEVLHKAFRHPIAHRGIPSGVWLDGGRQRPRRRITWNVDEHEGRPALKLTDATGELIFDSPWPTPHTHRMFIHLGALRQDVVAGANAYIADLEDVKLQENFWKCMEQLYPK